MHRTAQTVGIIIDFIFCSPAVDPLIPSVAKNRFQFTTYILYSKFFFPSSLFSRQL